MTLSSPPLAAALVRCGDRCTRELIEELQAADETLVEHGAGVANLAVTLGWRLGIGSERLITLCRAAHARHRIRSLGGAIHEVEVSGMPIIGASGFNGAMVFFWLAGEPLP